MSRALGATDMISVASAISSRRVLRAVLPALLLLIAAAPAISCRSEAESLTLEQAVGQMLLIGFRGLELESEVRALLREVQPGGVVLFDYDGPSRGELPRNIESPDQLRALTTQLQEFAEIPLLIAIDAEGGYVNRLKEKYGFAVLVPTAQTLGAGPVSETASIAAALAAELAEAGINWDLAPVVDVNIDPESPAIGHWERSFSDDPSVVAAHAEAFLAALQDGGIAPTLKHFPGHGSASGDTHLGVTDVTETYQQETELAPYRALIDAGYDGAVMTAHIVNRQLDPSGRPATLSRAIMTDLLRGELGFNGVIVSDDMQMGAIVEQYSLTQAAIKAIQAGVDIIVLANQAGDYALANVYQVRDAILNAVASGQIPKAQIHKSANRILTLKRTHNIR